MALSAAVVEPGQRSALVDVSRDFDRPELKDRTADQAEQRALALGELDSQAQERTVEVEQEKKDEQEQKEKDEAEAANQWVLPVATYNLTSRFGQTGGLWSSGMHTGLDFAGPSGTEIVAMAQGTVESAGYSGAYGLRTVIRLNDGTEIWYAHQSRITVTAGQVVQPGDVTGYTGATGNVTGPHLHLEVRPQGGDPVDPAATMMSHGLQL